MERLEFPKVTKVSPKLLADDIFPYIPGDEENMKIWEEDFKKIAEKIKKEFKEKKIPLPKIEINYSRKPISEDEHPLMRPLKK